MHMSSSETVLESAIRYLDEGRGLIRVIEAGHPGMKLRDEMTGYQSLIDQALVEQGGVLFRGFDVEGVDDFQTISETYAGELQTYGERSTPRTSLGGKVYTSTEYPPDQIIPQHNENSYARSWPRTLFFHCVTPAEAGGETPVADSREVLAAIPQPIRNEFRERGLLYVRNIGGQVDLPWQTVFQTDNKAEVERMCNTGGVDYEWLDKGARLRTRSRLPAVARHPVTGDELWFNQAHLFHISNLPEEVVEYMYTAMKEENFPRNTYFGDGAAIPTDYLVAIRQAYESAQVDFSWEENDFLILDNMLVTHGRKPFKGSRKVVVALAHPWSDHGI